MSFSNKHPIDADKILYSLLQALGMWQPLNWNSRWESLLYKTYSALMITTYFAFATTFLLYLYSVWEDINIFIEYLYYLLYCVVILIKQISIIIKRKTIIDSRKMLSASICQPRDFYESEILEKCSKQCRRNIILFVTLLNISGVTIIMSPIIIKNKIELPLKGWYPYKIETKQLFWLTFFFQVIGIEISTFTLALVEALALNLILKICAQLEICIHRFRLLSNVCKEVDSNFQLYFQETKVLGDCMHHHIHIYSLGRKLNDLFGLILFVQFFASIISLCVIIYQLTRLNSRNPTYWMMSSFLSTALMQIFLYCYYGEKITEKSLAVADAVYEIDWTNLSNKTKNNLIVMMLRTSKPIQLSGSSVVVMSIKTYVNILKSAYSAYNLLGNI